MNSQLPTGSNMQNRMHSQLPNLSHLMTSSKDSEKGEEEEESDYPLSTLEKLVEYLDILDGFATNIVQFDHLVSETGKSDGLVNFYLYKRFLKEKKKLENCLRGGANIFNSLDFFEVTD